MEESANIVSIAVRPGTANRLATTAETVGGLGNLASLLFEWLEQQSEEQQRSIIESAAMLELSPVSYTEIDPLQLSSASRSDLSDPSAEPR